MLEFFYCAWQGRQTGLGRWWWWWWWRGGGVGEEGGGGTFGYLAGAESAPAI